MGRSPRQQTRSEIPIVEPGIARTLQRALTRALPPN
jgi:hypothetical protein